ncbi:Ig-like domain-containing protein, partial [Legionella brunensis]
MATVTGTSTDDTLTGTSSNDTINGGAGDDTLSGGDGNDKLMGGQGEDIISGDAGNDTITGGEGDDILSGGSGNDSIDGGNGSDIVIHTSINSADIDVYNGGAGFDTLIFELTTPEYQFLQTEIEALRTWIANNANSNPLSSGYDANAYFTFNGINLSVRNFEAVEIIHINTAPIAHDDTINMSEDTPITISPAALLANDTDVDPDVLQIIEVKNAVNGTVQFVDGVITFTPLSEFNGIASFEYVISDGAGGTSTAIATLNVAEVNDAPTANADNAVVAEDSSNNVINVLDNDSKGPANEAGQTLSVISASALNGSVTINADGTLSYTANANYFGEDTITYTIKDNGTTNGAADSKTAVGTVAINVTEINDAPIANSDSAVVAEDSSNNVINVLDNDSKGPPNEAGQTLSVISATALHGSVTINADGTLSYTANANYFGEDTITYTIKDNGTTNGTADPKTAVGTVAINVTEINDAPIANPDSAVVAEDSINNVINVLGNDSKGPANEAGQTLSVISATALHGTVTINADGTLSYTANTNYFGDDTITYTIKDNGTTNAAADPKTATSSVSITVTEVNDAPTAAPDSATVDQGSSNNFINVLGNDVAGPSNEAGQTLSVIGAAAAHGSVVINADGTLSYTPLADYYGTDTINYTIGDNGTTNGAPDPKMATSSVSITINPIGGSIGDFVFADLNADTHHNFIEPGIAGIGIGLYRDAGELGVRDALDELVDFKVTDSNGYYQFTNVTPGNYWVDVDEVSVNYNIPNHTLTSGSEPTLVTVGAGQIIDSVDFGYAPGGIIGDIVFRDDNADGVQSASEQGLANIGVSLYRDAGILGERDADDQLIEFKVTDANGFYQFVNVAPGQYWVDVDEFAVSNNLPGGTLSTGNEPYLINLAAAQVVNNIDFGYAPGGIIG